MRFRKKPVVIEAVQFTGDNVDEVQAFIGGHGEAFDTFVYIETLEGKMTGARGDWIIKGIKGEIYTCKPDIFEATYERVYEGDHP